MILHSSESVSNVLQSWELARQRHSCEENIGMYIIQRLFEIDPSTKALYGFEVEKQVNYRGMMRAAVLVHGISIVRMLDEILSSLGPDPNFMEGLLQELGGRYRRLGAKPAFFVALGMAINDVLSNLLGNSWSFRTERAWKEVYGNISNRIIEAM